MKKKILSLAVIAMSMFSINAVAQNPTTNNAPAKECKKECKASQCNDKKCDKQCPALFSGIILAPSSRPSLRLCRRSEQPRCVSVLKTRRLRKRATAGRTTH